MNFGHPKSKSWAVFNNSETLKPILLYHGRPKLPLCLHLRLLNKYKFSTLLDHRCALREICLPCDLFPLWETLVTIVTPFHLKYQTERFNIKSPNKQSEFLRCPLQYRILCAKVYKGKLSQPCRYGRLL